MAMMVLLTPKTTELSIFPSKSSVPSTVLNTMEPDVATTCVYMRERRRDVSDADDDDADDDDDALGF
jgi:hypothetical protein